MFKHHLYEQAGQRGSSGVGRAVWPWACALAAGALAIATSVMQAQSKDLLPSFVAFPAIVGAVCSGPAGVACVVGFFVLRKGEGYHDKHADSDPHSLKAKHPIQFAAYFIFAATIAAVIAEGAYLVTFTPATSKAQCKVRGRGGIYGLLILTVCGYLFEKTVSDAVSWFNLRKVQHSNQYHGRSSEKAAPPAYPATDPYDNQFDDDMYDRRGGWQ
ncbi:hypothetical protein JCM10213_004913 [Rhodosporidiobolus nylandii]